MAVESLTQLAIMLVIAGVVIGMGTVILSEFRTQVSSNVNATAVIDRSVSALGTVSNWFPLITIVAAAAVILGIVLGVFGPLSGRRAGGE
ncbi:MAG: hypothetical protein RMJ67_06635 [Elusimicrobiota bacterium]|nr:hypothetical protein [Endomicrobiia bacterium]MDW8166170.1 hypothetical protein [Elusimicrobiota bacterium]